MTLSLEWEAVVDERTEGEISISGKNTFYVDLLEAKRSATAAVTGCGRGRIMDERTIAAAKRGSDSTDRRRGSSESAANRLNK